MSKWTEARDVMASCPHISEECLTAFDIADRLEKAENTLNSFIYAKGCINCNYNCGFKLIGRYGSNIDWYFEGYKQALSDVRGDTNE